ncbi:MAG: twin-arginine translocase subunit TatC, partial [Cryobacterium sp.]|nr:twin-arginine translocase subunit TatC [Cryobacterium sp.]
MAARERRGENRERRMSLGQHLVELRKRLFRAALGVLAGAVVGFILSEWIVEKISGPIAEVAATRNAVLNFSQVTSSFDLRMQIAIYVGLFLSSPVWLYQIFAF